MSDQTEIQFPVTKAVLALSSGAGAQVVSDSVERAASFLPHDLAGWMAVLASGIAFLYSAHLLGEWYWKKVVSPFLRRKRGKRA